VLELAKGKLGICIDIKNTSEAQIIDLIIKMQMLKDVYLMSYNIEKLKNINTINPQIQTVLIKNTLTHVDLDIAQEIGCSGVSTSYFSSEFLTNKAHDKGLIYWAGIVNDPAKAERLFNNKVDAIITNYPQLMTMNTDDEIITYPNPFRESINIHFNLVDDIERIFIIGVNGSIVHKFFAPYSNPIIWEPHIKLSRGLYLIFMIKNEKTIFEKILFID